MIKFRKQLAALFLAAIAGSPCFADVPKDATWPQFRGPARDNISKEIGLLKEWPKEGPPLAWKAKGIGDAHASVSIADGRIFTSGADDNGEIAAFALSEKDGKPIWKAKVGGLGGNGDDQGGKGSRSTPTVDGDMVYVLGPVGDVVALGAADGKPAWHVNLKKDFGGGMPYWGYSDSLLIEGDNVLCIPGGKQGTVLALNKKTGKQAWRTTDFKDDAHYTSLIPAEIGGVHQDVILTPSNVAGIDPKDGKVLWKVERKGQTAVCPSPVVHDNYVYVTSGYSVGCDLFKINNDGGKFSVEPIYTHKTNRNMVNHHGGVIYLDGCIYGYHDRKGWVCQDFMTGETKWADKKSVGKGTISYADGHFYIRDEGSGAIALIEATPTAYKEISHFTPPDLSHKPYWPHMVIANGKLYVRDMDTLLCYDIKAK